MPKRRQSKTRQDPDLLSCYDAEESTVIHPELRADRGFIQMSAKDHAAEDQDLVIRASEGDIGAFRNSSGTNRVLYIEWRFASWAATTPGREPGGVDQGLEEHKELQGRERFLDLAIQDHSQRLPQRQAEGGAPGGAGVQQRRDTYLPAPPALMPIRGCGPERGAPCGDSRMPSSTWRRAQGGAILGAWRACARADIAEILDVPDGTGKGWVSGEGGHARGARLSN